jgi:hypothetical protein
VIVDASISGVIVFVLVLVMDRGVGESRLRSILKEEHGYYSLTKVQFSCWTVIFLFSLLWVYIVRIQGGVLTPIDLLKQPGNTLALMGINTASALGSLAIRKKKESEKEQPEWRKDAKFWWILFSESPEKEAIVPDLTRVQFFIWTVVSIVIYLGILVGQMIGPYFGFSSLVPLQSLRIPDIDPSLVTLMGLSHVGYVGGKYVQRRNTPKTAHRSPFAKAPGPRVKDQTLRGHKHQT